MINAVNKKKYNPLLASALALLFLSSNLCAIAPSLASITPNKVHLNLIETYQLALNSDPILKAAQARYQAQKESVPQAMAQFLPQINAQGSNTWIDSGQGPFSRYNTQAYNLNISQPIIHLELFSELSQAKQIKQQALAALLAADQDLMIRTAEQYFFILGANDTLFFSTAQRKAFLKQYEQAKLRFEVGLIAITDVLEAKAGYDNAIAVEIAANNALSDQYEELRKLIGILPHTIADIDPTKKIPLLAPNPQDQEAWVYTANSHNLEIQINQAIVKQAKANISTQRAGHLPTIDLSIQTGYFKPQPPALKTFFPNQVISLNANLPLFQGGAVMSRTRQAQAQYSEALQNLDYRRRVVDSDTRQQYRGILTGISEIKAFSESVISNKSALKAIRAGYSAGTRTIVDVLNAESTLLKVERDYALSRYFYLLEGLRLKRSAGILKCEDLEHVNHFLTNHPAS